MMQKKTVVAMIFIIAIVEPLTLYANLHVRVFSGGLFYGLFNVLYPPSNYKRPVLEALVVQGERRAVDIEHRYKGRYDVFIFGSFIQDKSAYYEVHIDCNADVGGIYKSSDSPTTDSYRQKYDEISIGSYVADDWESAHCQLSLQSDDIDDAYVKIIKQTHS